MSGIANWQAQIRIDIEDLKKRIKVAEGEINNFTNEDRKVKLDIDTKTLESAIQKLDKMLDSLGKGTGDFKQFENLSKELSSIVLEVQSLSKAFGKVDDSGAKTLLSSIQNIDKSLSELSQNILNVNKNISNMGGNTSGAVKQVENISNAYQDAAKEAEKLADVQSKIGQKTNISFGDSTSNAIDTQVKKQREYNDLVAVGYDRIQKMKRISESGTTGQNSVYDLLRLNHEAWDEVKANNFFNTIPEEGLKRYTKILEVVEKIVQEMVQASGLTEDQIVSQLKNIKSAQGGNFKLNGADSGWTHFATYSNGQKDSMQKPNGITYKVYAAFDDIKDLNQNVVSSIMDELTKAGFKGRLKTTSGSTSFGDKLNGLAITDQMVVHGSTKKDQEIAYNTLKNMGLKLSYLGGGIDTPDGSFSQTLASGEINKYVQGLEKEATTARDTAKAEQELANARKESTSTVSQNQKKDAFPKTSENLEQVAQSEQKVQQEAVATDKALDNISFTPNTEGFDDIIAKFGILREQAEQITKIVKTTKQTADGTPNISYKATLRNGSSYYLGENSTPQVLNASETVYDAKAVAKNAEQEAKAIQAEWDKNIKAIQDYMDAMTKLNNLKAKDKGTGSEANQIELQTQNVEKLKQVAWDARKNLSSMQAENPDIIAWKQWVDMMELFDQASEGSAESAAKLKDVLDNIKVPSLDKYENKLASYQTKKGAYNATIARFNDGGWTSDEYLKNVQAVKDAVKKYEDLLNNIKAKGGIASENDVQNLKEYESEIKKTISTVTNMSAAEKGYNFVSGQKELDKIHKLLNENSKMSSEAKAKIKAYYKEIESGNPSMSLDRIHGEIMKIYNAEVEAGRAGRSFFDTLKNSGFHQLAAQMAGMFGFYDVINLGKQAFNTVKELDYALVDLKKTTAMNSSELEQFYYDSNDVAKQMGVTTKEIIDQASSWSRLGYNSKQAATEMAKLSSQFSLISPGMDTTTAQEGLVSIMKAWDIGYQDVKSQIMDDINALGNAMAEDNQDIVEGMERSAAALAAVGTSTKDAFALFSGIQEVLQNSEKSGTSLRSVALRLRSFDESTEEYSSDLANITGELADLTKTAEHAQGVSVFKPGSTTEFKNLVDYFREIADIWDEMSQKQQNDFLLKAFGRTQAQAGAALIQNFKGVEKALDVMDNAIGSSDKEMETAKQSITYKLNELKQTWVGTVQDIANRDDLGKIVDGLTDLSSAIGFVIDKLGLVGTVGLFGGAGTGIFKFIKNFDWVFKPYTKTLSNSFLVGQS